MSPFEAGMLLCFGISWPMSIYKSLKTRHVSGKSPLFMIIVDLGYVCGILHKFGVLNKNFTGVDWVVWLYVLNLVMVSFDLSLYYLFSAREKRAALAK